MIAPGALKANAAFFFALTIFAWQVAVPLQAPEKPAKSAPDAVSTATCPWG